MMADEKQTEKSTHKPETRADKTSETVHLSAEDLRGISGGTGVTGVTGVLPKPKKPPSSG